MNKVFKTVVLAFGTIFLMSTSAFGQSDEKKDGKKPPSFSELLEKMDENEDERLSEKEIKGPLREHFDTIDADEDGFITEEELKKAPKPKRRERD
jgi:Ca2+-binding EF-hand superfamily protein